MKVTYMTLTARDINPTGIFYHVAPIPLENGSIIKKGNWGRIVKIDGMHDKNWIGALREKSYETYRINNCPTLPSRLDCIFACTTEQLAQNYKVRYNPRGIVYEVVATNPDCNVHVGSYERGYLLGNNAIIDYDLNIFRNLVALYWGTNWLNEPDSEILLDSDIRIIREV